MSTATTSFRFNSEVRMFDNSRQLLRCCHSTATNPAVFCSTPLHQVKLELSEIGLDVSIAVESSLDSLRLTWAEA